MLYFLLSWQLIKISVWTEQMEVMLIHTTAQASTLASVEKHNEKTVPKLYVTTTIQVNATGRPMSSARRSLSSGHGSTN